MTGTSVTQGGEGEIITTGLTRVGKLSFVLRPLQFFPSTHKEGGQPSLEEANHIPDNLLSKYREGESGRFSLGPGILREKYHCGHQNSSAIAVVWPHRQEFPLQTELFQRQMNAMETSGKAFCWKFSFPLLSYTTHLSPGGVLGRTETGARCKGVKGLPWVATAPLALTSAGDPRC